jgi:hypothetical protein
LHDELDTVIRQTFRAMQRQLKGLTEKQRGDVKTHEAGFAEMDSQE